MPAFFTPGQLVTLTVLLTSSLVRAQELTFKVLEESGPGLLGNIAEKANLTAVLGHQELNSLQYTVVDDSGGANSLFYVDQTSGDLSTKTTLDRERLCGVAATCTVRGDVAVQSSSPESAFFRKFSIVVHVLDANDHMPTFTQTSFTVGVSESETLGRTFRLPSATDGDVEEHNRVQRYALEPSFPEFDLTMAHQETASGQTQYTVALKLVNTLDREGKQLYTTSLVAYDGGNPPRRASLPLAINVQDENDNAPLFEKREYSKTLTEESQANAVILTVSARDADEGDNARVSYFLSDFADITIQSLFSVNEDTGVVSLKASLSNRGGNTYRFEVIAQDNGVPKLSSKCRIVVQVLDTHNDRPEIEVNPLFSRHGAAVVPESAAIGRVTALMTVVDHDSGRNGLVTCQLNNAYFSLQKLELNEYKIIVAANLDRERQGNHTVLIRCSDGGDPPLSTERVLKVEVSDSNDNTPEFSSKDYILSVPENEVVGTWVGQVTAQDLDSGDNAHLIYGMEDNGKTFTIDTMLGDIYTTQFLDREKTPHYVFNVYAYDKSASPLTAMTTVVVNIEDKNDMKPVFTNNSYQFRVDERTPPGTKIGQLKAVDEDLGLNGRVEYYMVTSQSRPRFPISVNSSGAILVTGDVDYEISNLFTFMVAAVDLGTPPQNSTCHVTIEVMDKNDHSPVITFPSPENPSVNIPFDTAPGSEIAKVVAYDLDSGPNGDLRYSIRVSNKSALFLIDEVTGIIKLGHQLLPDDIRSFNVVVSVHDNGVPQIAQQAVLRIDVTTSDEMAAAAQNNFNLQIVIAMVCVTLVLAIAVLVTLLLIRLFDRRRRNAAEKHRHEILTKSDYQPQEYDKEAGLRTTTVFTSKRETTTVYSPKRAQQSASPPLENNSLTKNKKKCVSFEKEPISEEEGPGGYPSPGRQISRDMYPIPDECSVGNFSTFKPSSRTPPYTEQGGSSGVQEKEPGDAVHFALRQHNALVRSIRNSRPPTYQQTMQRGDKDVEVWSSSSNDTSDSGHGGSELDVSMVKVNLRMQQQKQQQQQQQQQQHQDEK
ncbi:protocadherin-9-like [Babylonia areolata]|uniref:protocadherin-9-like n=1 Tax=Babylonia areolata TaxID=304850 RepID=UPI003FD5A705